MFRHHRIGEKKPSRGKSPRGFQYQTGRFEKIKGVQPTSIANQAKNAGSNPRFSRQCSKANWIKQIEVFDETQEAYATLALFPEDRLAPSSIGPAVQIRLGEFEVCRPRQWGACWLALWLWKILNLDEFWSERLPASREGTQWILILKALSVYRLVDPGSEWRFHRQWFDGYELSDLLVRIRLATAV